MNKYYEANAAFAKFSRKYMEHKKSLPIRPSEMGVLNIITQTPGPHTSVMIAERLEVSKPMITAHLNVLLEKGYVTKQQVPEDKRAFYILPTEKALELVASAREEMEQQLEYLLQGMGEEDFSELIRLLGKANEILIIKHDDE